MQTTFANLQNALAAYARDPYDPELSDALDSANTLFGAEAERNRPVPEFATVLVALVHCCLDEGGEDFCSAAMALCVPVSRLVG